MPKKHGLSYEPEYKAWQTMRLRCTVPANAAYASYGGRGIKVCERWMNSVEAFMQDMGKKPTPKHELDRINNDGNYEPSNCRWATRSENDRNRRSTVWVMFHGQRRKYADLCEEFNMDRTVVRHRLRAGWSVEHAFETKTRAKAKNKPKQTRLL